MEMCCGTALPLLVTAADLGGSRRRESGASTRRRSGKVLLCQQGLQPQLQLTSADKLMRFRWSPGEPVTSYCWWLGWYSHVKVCRKS